MCGSNTSKRMTPFLRVPSRSLCRLLWTQAEYLEITKIMNQIGFFANFALQENESLI